MNIEPASYPLVLTQKSEIARQTMEFRFKKPAGFEYKAGQSMRLKIPGHDEERTLSLVTAPHEDDLAFAVRVRGSDFKKKLKAFNPGDTLIASGPSGKFGLHEDESVPALYIAGGIGITIYLSILSHIRHTASKHSIVLLYSNRNKEDISYGEQLKDIAHEVAGISVVFILSKEKPNVWEGELGRIDRDMIKRHAPDLRTTLCYVAGSPAMVESMDALLSGLGVPAENLHTKRFKGY